MVAPVRGKAWDFGIVHYWEEVSLGEMIKEHFGNDPENKASSEILGVIKDGYNRKLPSQAIKMQGAR